MVASGRNILFKNQIQSRNGLQIIATWLQLVVDGDNRTIPRGHVCRNGSNLSGFNALPITIWFQCSALKPLNCCSAALTIRAAR